MKSLEEKQSELSQFGFTLLTGDLIKTLVPVGKITEVFGENTEWQLQILEHTAYVLGFTISVPGGSTFVKLRFDSQRLSVCVDDYENDRTFIGNGLTVAFYKKLEVLLAGLGVKYLYGKGDEANVQFYTEKLGRRRTNESESAEIEQITSCTTESALRYMTHKRLINQGNID